MKYFPQRCKNITYLERNTAYQLILYVLFYILMVLFFYWVKYSYRFGWEFDFWSLLGCPVKYEHIRTSHFFSGIISYQLFGIIKIMSLPFSIVMWLASPAFGNRNRYEFILDMYGAAYTHCFQAKVSGIELSLRLLSLLENVN